MRAMADDAEEGATPNHAFEPAPSGRARCRACGQAIAKAEVRFGEKLANPFADGDMTVWFHPRCAALRRPEPLLQALSRPDASAAPADRGALQQTAEATLAHPKLQRIDGAERAPTAQAKCRHCHEPIPRAEWRVKLAFWEEGRFTPGGFIHLRCGRDYFDAEPAQMVEPLLHFSAALDDAARDELRRACMPDAANAPSG